jgi:hypothetical protein
MMRLTNVSVENDRVRVLLDGDAIYRVSRVT